MTYVLIESGVVVQKQPYPQDGFVEAPDDVICGWLYDGENFTAPEPGPSTEPPPYLNHTRLVRFIGTSPVNVLENVGMGTVLRLSAGRYRCFHADPMPSSSYSVVPSYLDTERKNVRVHARTASYVEIRTTDTSDAASDTSEITLQTTRVIT